MKEDFLHYVWRMRRFDHAALQTTTGEPVEVLQVGNHNTHAGPDFTNARLRIGDTLWAGNVEMHLNASEWLQHGHQHDRAYDNVVLHVVMEEDQPILRPNGERIPCLALKARVPAGLLASYQRLLHTEHWIPCQHEFYTMPRIGFELWLDRLLVERLEGRTAAMMERLAQNQYNWEETFYQFLARSFGVQVNMDPFEELARSLPLVTLAKHKGSLFQIEALLFGQAGLLAGDFQDEYPQKLRQEYQFLRQKYSLSPMKGEAWKFLRMRPANFPSVRLAQFAVLVHQSAHLFSKILAAASIAEVENMFEVKLSNYWQDHYVFDKPSEHRPKSIGKSTIHLLTVNTIAPFLFLYGKHKGEDKYKDKALAFLEQLPAEANNIISAWKALGVSPSSAYQTQALIELKKNYCQQRRCLECPVGHHILK